MEWMAFAASVLTAFLSFLGVYISNRKQAALIDYRVKEIEKRLDKTDEKIGKHNNLEGRIIALETHVKDLHAG